MKMQTETTAQSVTPTPQPRRITRRRLLTQAVALSVTAGGLGLMAGCGRSGDDADDESPSVASAGNAAAVCDDAAELSEQDLARRRAVQYVDVSSQQGKTCRQCRFFKPSQDDDEGCGSCDILAGPVASGGYCNAFVPR